MTVCTKTEFARALGHDVRSIERHLTKVVAYLAAGREKLLPLYEFPSAQITAAIAVNSGVQHPLKEGALKL